MTLFERAFVISLPFRTDRLESFRKQTASLRSLPEIEVWPAVHGDTCQPPDIWTAGAGAWGCYRSHMNILEYCLNNRIDSYIVFEDDAQFRPGFDENLEQFYNALPDDWQQIYLGGQLIHEHTHPPIRVNDHVFRPFNINRTHCFAVSHLGMLPIYKHISNLPFAGVEHIDHHLGRWHEDARNNVYAPNRWLVGQMGYDSDIKGAFLEVTYFPDPCSLQLKHWLYDNPICIYYTGSKDLLRSARSYLYPGKNLDAHGFDITLALAAKYAEPAPEISRWYNWIRSELVRSNSSALPCFNHPVFKPEQIESILNCKVIVLGPHTLDELKASVNQIIKDHAE